MRVWRICKKRWKKSAFDGEGARRAGGRWNHKGTPVVYTSSSLALAALQLFVHLEPEEAPDDLIAIDLLIPDDMSFREIDVSELPPNWRDYPAPAKLKELGTDWIKSANSLMLMEPSVAIPHETNALINPAHPEFPGCVAGDGEPFHFDSRMWR